VLCSYFNISLRFIDLYTFTTHHLSSWSLQRHHLSSSISPFQTTNTLCLSKCTLLQCTYTLSLLSCSTLGPSNSPALFLHCASRSFYRYNVPFTFILHQQSTFLLTFTFVRYQRVRYTFSSTWYFLFVQLRYLLAWRDGFWAISAPL